MSHQCTYCSIPVTKQLHQQQIHTLSSIDRCYCLHLTSAVYVHRRVLIVPVLYLPSFLFTGDVLKLSRPTDIFLCPLSANTYGIDFLSFRIRDMDSGAVLFEVSKDANAPAPVYPPDFDTDQLRSIEYKFPAQFLRYDTVGTTYVDKWVQWQEMWLYSAIARVLTDTFSSFVSSPAVHSLSLSSVSVSVSALKRCTIFVWSSVTITMLLANWWRVTILIFISVYQTRRTNG